MSELLSINLSLNVGYRNDNCNEFGSNVFSKENYLLQSEKHLSKKLHAEARIFSRAVISKLFDTTLPADLAHISAILGSD
jgi:hypothetical protein